MLIFPIRQLGVGHLDNPLYNCLYVFEQQLKRVVPLHLREQMTQPRDPLHTNIWCVIELPLAVVGRIASNITRSSPFEGKLFVYCCWIQTGSYENHRVRVDLRASSASMSFTGMVIWTWEELPEFIWAIIRYNWSCSTSLDPLLTESKWSWLLDRMWQFISISLNCHAMKTGITNLERNSFMTWSSTIWCHWARCEETIDPALGVQWLFVQLHIGMTKWFKFMIVLMWR